MASGVHGGTPLVARVVSGGQSGVDRAATDVAIAHGIPYGGWVPRGGWAEDLPDPPGVLADYPAFRATDSADPAVRTRRNVVDADAVLVVSLGPLDSPGTALTCASASARGLALAMVELPVVAEDAALGVLAASLPRGATLLVAGPRESEQPGVYDAARAFLERRAPTLFGRCADAAAPPPPSWPSTASAAGRSGAP